MARASHMRGAALSFGRARGATLGALLRLLALPLAALASRGCTAARGPDAQCAFNGQCAQGLVCAAGVCRAGCRTDRDCVGGGAVCRPTGAADGGACVPPDAPQPCVSMGDCPGATVCARDGVCRAQCRADRDCVVRAPWHPGLVCRLSDGVCAPPTGDGGAPDAAAPDAPRLLAPLSGALVGGPSITLHWQRPADVTSVFVEDCTERTCAPAATTVYPVVGTQDTVTLLVASATVRYWRVRPRLADGSPGSPTPTWQYTTSASTRADRGMAVTPMLYHATGIDTPGLAVGVPQAGASGGGRVDVFAGDMTFGVGRSAATRLFGPAGALTFGGSLAVAGDMNADGLPELAVADQAVHRIYFTAGSPSGLPVAPAVSFDAGAGFAAVQVASAGDVDNDQHADVLYAAAAGTGNTVGLLRGVGTTALYQTSTVVMPPTANAEFGHSVAGAGDVDGDGFSDVVVGAPGAYAQAGAAYVYRGDNGGINVASMVELVGDGAANARFGGRVASAGDVNGDGYADVAVLEQPARATGLRPRLWIYYGGPAGVGATNRVAADVPPTIPTSVGGDVRGLGDTNGDGYADVLVTTVDELGMGGGRGFVFLGSATGPSVMSAVGLVPLVPDAVASPSNFGVTATAPGDLNGDGYADLAIGAPGAGLVVVHFGHRNGVDMGAPPVTLPAAPAAGETFGEGLPH